MCVHNTTCQCEPSCRQSPPFGSYPCVQLKNIIDTIQHVLFKVWFVRGAGCALATCEVEKDWVGPIINHLKTSHMRNNRGSNRWQSGWKTTNTYHVESIEANWELNLRGCSGLGGSKVLQFDGLKIKIDNMGENEARGWSLQNAFGSGMHHWNWWSGGRSERRVHTKNHLKGMHDQHWGSCFGERSALVKVIVPFQGGRGALLAIGPMHLVGGRRRRH